MSCGRRRSSSAALKRLRCDAARKQRLPAAAGQLERGGHSQQREDVDAKLGQGRGGHSGPRIIPSGLDCNGRRVGPYTRRVARTPSREAWSRGRPKSARAAGVAGRPVRDCRWCWGWATRSGTATRPSTRRWARRIAVNGDWWHLFDNNGPFLNKPPLALWGIALFVKLLRADPRRRSVLPALLFGVVMLIAVARIGTLVWSRATGGPPVPPRRCWPAHWRSRVMVGDPKVDMAITAMSACAVWMAFEGAAAAAGDLAGMVVRRAGGSSPRGRSGWWRRVAAVLPRGAPSPVGLGRARHAALAPVGGSSRWACLVAAAVVFPFVRADCTSSSGAAGTGTLPLQPELRGGVLNQRRMERTAPRPCSSCTPGCGRFAARSSRR